MRKERSEQHVKQQEGRKQAGQDVQRRRQEGGREAKTEERGRKSDSGKTRDVTHLGTKKLTVSQSVSQSHVLRLVC